MIERLNPFQFSTFGHYSQGVKIDLGPKTMILTAGQLALNDDGTPVAPGDFTAQSRFIFKRIQQILETAGASLDDVVKAIGEDNIWDQIKMVGKFGDHYYGLVHAAGTSLLVYRKDLAQKKGLKGPKTWDDLLNLAKELTMDTNGDGKTDIYGMTIPGINLFINILMGELTKANGGILFDENNRPHFTDKSMIETLNFLKELTKYMPEKPKTVLWVPH